MKIRMRTLAGFIRKEFIQIFRDPKMLVALFFIPLMQLIMFGLALTSEVKNIELAVISRPSALAREVQTRALASGWFKNVQGIDPQNITAPSQLLTRRQAEAVLVAPAEGLEAALERGDKPVQILVNAINAQRAQQVDTYIRQILARTAAAHGYNLSGPGLIQLDTRVLFNHYMDTTDFMVPALLVMSSFIVLLIVCSMSITKEKETGTMEKLIASPVSTAEILLGKTLPYFILGLAIIGAMLAVGIWGFSVAWRGSVLQLFINAVILISCALSVATLLSTVTHTQQQAMMGGVLILLPAILLSGVFFPVANIPAAFRWACYLNPMMYATANFRNVILKGGDWSLFWQYAAFASGLALLLALAAYKNFKEKLN